MRIALGVAAAAALLSAARLEAQSPRISLEAVEMSPASPATLHNAERLYVRVRYDTDQPMRIVARYSVSGERVRAARTNGEALLNPGRGEALVWVAFTTAAAVDTIDLSASSSGRDGFASQRLSVDYTWDGRASAGETRAPWVEPLLAQEEARQKAEFAELERRFGSGGVGAVNVGLAGGVMLVALLLLVAAFVWPIWGALKWKGPWRVAAMVPIAAVVLWAVKDAVDLAIDPTSHNLLPFEFVIAAVLTLPYMLVVTIWRRTKLK